MTRDDEDAIEVLLSKQDQLTEWELEFLENIQDLPSITPNQRRSLDKIWNKVMIR